MHVHDAASPGRRPDAGVRRDGARGGRRRARHPRHARVPGRRARSGGDRGRGRPRGRAAGDPVRGPRAGILPLRRRRERARRGQPVAVVLGGAGLRRRPPTPRPPRAAHGGGRGRSTRSAATAVRRAAPGSAAAHRRPSSPRGDPERPRLRGPPERPGGAPGRARPPRRSRTLPGRGGRSRRPLGGRGPLDVPEPVLPLPAGADPVRLPGHSSRLRRLVPLLGLRELARRVARRRHRRGGPARHRHLPAPRTGPEGRLLPGRAHRGLRLGRAGGLRRAVRAGGLLARARGRLRGRNAGAGGVGCAARPGALVAGCADRTSVPDLGSYRRGLLRAGAPDRAVVRPQRRPPGARRRGTAGARARRRRGDRGPVPALGGPGRDAVGSFGGRAVALRMVRRRVAASRVRGVRARGRDGGRRDRARDPAPPRPRPAGLAAGGRGLGAGPVERGGGFRRCARTGIHRPRRRHRDGVRLPGASRAPAGGCVRSPGGGDALPRRGPFGRGRDPPGRRKPSAAPRPSPVQGSGTARRAVAGRTARDGAGAGRRAPRAEGRATAKPFPRNSAR